MTTTTDNANNWQEYASLLSDEAYDAYHRHRNICPSCDGFGDHGVEEETGRLYICFGCGGTGKYRTDCTNA